MAERLLLSVGLAVAGWLLLRAVVFVQQIKAQRVENKEPERERPTLYLFTSPTCGLCKFQQIPIVEQLRDEMGDGIEVAIVDVTEQPELAAEFGILSVPTTVVVNGSGRLPAINHGLAAAAKLRAQLVDSSFGEV